MFDHELAMNALNQVSRLVNTIIERTEGVRSIDDFLCDPSGGMLLDAVCMNLIALGEATKNLDKNYYRGVADLLSSNTVGGCDAYEG